MKDIEKEILVVENIIRILHDCLEISQRHGRKAECRRTIKDIRKTEEELTRLKAIREVKKTETEDQAREKIKPNEAALH